MFNRGCYEAGMVAETFVKLNELAGNHRIAAVTRKLGFLKYLRNRFKGFLLQKVRQVIKPAM
jgi:hypothetical protein